MGRGPLACERATGITMKDAPGTTHENPLISKLLAAGIDPEALAGAAEAARVLCAQSAPVDGGCLAPRHHLDYQQLLEELAGEPPV